MEEKIIISINECRPGMKIAETIFNDYGAVIIARDTIINNSIIEKLEELGLKNIKIFSTSDIKTYEKNIINDQYNTYIDTVEDVIQDINSGKDLEMEKIEYVTNSLMDTLKENTDIMSCIKQVRDADEYTFTHSVNVSLLSMLIGKWLNLSQENVKDLVYAGMLHDIGKAKIDLAILNKPGKLTDEEFEEIKKHVVYGYKIVENIPDLNKDIKEAVLMHHERENGKGYVLSATKDKINLFAKIVAIADVYDAMTSNRVYRSKRTPFEVLEHIRDMAFSEFDPNIALTFLTHMANYYIGDKCILNNGKVAEIIFIDPNNIGKPVIKVGDECIYLEHEPDIKIVEVL